jgi:hypothetical protein
MTDQIPNGDKMPREKRDIQIDINEATVSGVYSNMTLSNVNQDEFVMDFIFLQPNVNKGNVRSRIIMTPKNVKQLVNMLTKQLIEYEKNMGPIGDGPPLPRINLSFN